MTTERSSAGGAFDPAKLDVSRLRIVEHPDPVLRQRAEPVPAITDLVRALCDRMVEIMRAADGIGLAAPQVGIPWRLFVVDVPPGEDRALEGTDDAPPSATPGAVVYINPVLTRPRGEVVAGEEGCLSLPEIRGDVLRPSIITITALDKQGVSFTRSASGLLARCWQHENDHLDGVLILDRMTQMSRLKNRSTVRELEKRAARGK
ncbi:MAG: peptide deformylase [Planctomycetota bacterium]|nr:peptide deformylase [Planctomycetota bacterium]